MNQQQTPSRPGFPKRSVLAAYLAKAFERLDQFNGRIVQLFNPWFKATHAAILAVEGVALFGFGVSFMQIGESFLAICIFITLGILLVAKSLTLSGIAKVLFALVASLLATTFLITVTVVHKPASEQWSNLLKLFPSKTKHDLVSPASSPATHLPTPSVNLPAPAPAKKKIHPFLADPILLLTFSPARGGVFRNRSDETLFISVFSTSVTLPKGEDSESYPIGKELKPGEDASFAGSLPGTWTSIFLPGNDWDSLWMNAEGKFGGCLRPLPFPADSPDLKQIVNHYRSMNEDVPVSDARGTFSYRRGSILKEQSIDLKALLFVRDGCTKSN